MPDGSALIEALEDPAAYPHPVEDLEVLETHISWVVLTGRYAYKIKKPIRLEFLDFSTLELRKRWCEEEIRLNSRWAPSVYIDVVPISGSVATPRMNGQGEALEFAVRMRQFPQSALLSSSLEDGMLTRQDMLDLAEMIADRHQAAPTNTSPDYGSPEAVYKPMRENFLYLEPQLDTSVLDTFERWTTETVKAERQTIIDRSRGGFVRECHGDLHLRNLVRLEEGIVAFDCIEFSDELRMLDVMSDLSFLTMDLVAASRRDLASVLLNRYLECTGDYEGMGLYRLYFVYHCLIRAKVHAIRLSELDDEHDAEGAQAALGSMHHYVDVAKTCVEAYRPGLIVMHGLSGSGKTRVSADIIERLGAIRLRSDIERKRLHGLREQDDSGSAPGAGLYSREVTGETYARLFELTRCLLEAGASVILDAAFLKQDERAAAARVATSCGAAYVIVAVEAPRQTLVERLEARQAAGRDASEAGVEVLELQEGIVEVPGSRESEPVIRFTNVEGADTDVLCSAIVEVLGTGFGGTC